MGCASDRDCYRGEQLLVLVQRAVEAVRGSRLDLCIVRFNVVMMLLLTTTMMMMRR